MQKKTIPERKPPTADPAERRTRPEATTETRSGAGPEIAAPGLSAPKVPKTKKKKKGSKRA